MYTIYKYTNQIDGKVYIGQTSQTLTQRAQSNGHNYIQCPRFYDAIRKYGWDAFIPEIIDTAETQEDANSLEEYYIAMFNSTDRKYGYNILAGGGMTLEAREKLAAKAIERYKDKTKNPMYGSRHSKETLNMMSRCKVGEKNPMYGTKWNETQRANCGTKGKKLNLSDGRREIMRQNMIKIGKETGLRPVRCIEDNVKFDSITHAAEAYGVKKSTLNGHLKGRQLSCAGKHFEYLD